MVTSNKENLANSTTDIKSNNNSTKNEEKINSDKQSKDDNNSNNKIITDKFKITTKFTCRQKLALLSLASAEFMSSCSMSIMAPFFPREAAKKGMSETISGFVFSFYALVMFISSPIFGKLLPKIGEKLLFNAGIVLAGFCSIMFGFLVYVSDYSTFVFLSFLIRGLEALGASGYATSCYVFVTNIFPENAGMVRGVLEIFVGLGMSAGPAIGGFLFSLGGFGLPFFVVGVFCLLITPLNLFLLPSSAKELDDKNSGSLIEMLRKPGVIVSGFVIVMISINWSFLDPTLEPHLRQFDLSTNNVGLLFLLVSATYGITSPGWGWLADKYHSHWSMMVIGLIASCVGLLLMGPSPLLPFLNNSLGIIIGSLSILGIAAGLALLPTFDGLLIYAVKGGLEDNIATQSITAGLWSCAYSFGEIIGPSVGGFLFNHYGFPITVTVLAVANLVLAIFCIFYFIITFRNYGKKSRFEDGVSIKGSWKGAKGTSVSSDNCERTDIC